MEIHDAINEFAWMLYVGAGAKLSPPRRIRERWQRSLDRRSNVRRRKRRHELARRVET